MHSKTTLSRGFTIVELLIVIVVIAILAAISVVAYTGIQERALNSARVNEAQQWHRILSLYATETNSYTNFNLPVGSAVCLGTGFPDSNNDGIGDCWDLHVPGHTRENTAYMTELSKVGSLPNATRKPIPGTGTTSRIGPAFVRDSANQYRIVYWLSGTGSCPAGNARWTDNSRSIACHISLPAL